MLPDSSWQPAQSTFSAYWGGLSTVAYPQEPPYGRDASGGVPVLSAELPSGPQNMLGPIGQGLHVFLAAGTACMAAQPRRGRHLRIDANWVPFESVSVTFVNGYKIGCKHDC